MAPSPRGRILKRCSRLDPRLAAARPPDRIGREHRWYPSSKTCSACGRVNALLTLGDRVWTCPGTAHDRDENAGTNLARLPASRAEAQSDSKTVLVRRAAVKRVNHPGRMAACASVQTATGLEHDTIDR